MTITNADRAAKAGLGLDAYTSENTGRYAEEDVQTRLSDLLGDLHHFARVEGVDIDACFDNGKGHAEAEYCGTCGGTAEDMGICSDCYDKRDPLNWRPETDVTKLKDGDLCLVESSACCDADKKGMESGVGCRACYSTDVEWRRFVAPFVEKDGPDWERRRPFDEDEDRSNIYFWG